MKYVSMCALRTLISDGLAIVPVARANSQLSPYILGQCSQELTGQLLLSPENNWSVVETIFPFRTYENCVGYIASTVRNEETYKHFCTKLGMKDNETLIALDISLITTI